MISSSNWLWPRYQDELGRDLSWLYLCKIGRQTLSEVYLSVLSTVSLWLLANRSIPQKVSLIFEISRERVVESCFLLLLCICMSTLDWYIHEDEYEALSSSECPRSGFRIMIFYEREERPLALQTASSPPCSFSADQTSWSCLLNNSSFQTQDSAHALVLRYHPFGNVSSKRS